MDIPIEKIVSRDKSKKLPKEIKSFTTPIVVKRMKNGKYKILDGQIRYLIALNLGMKTIPAHIIGAI